ncbi:MAG: UDP-3-O-[3-hydroxymyristoyl] N-acetylglucosamine deacetylase [Micavibrio sp.]|nr:UDP-3-O-[3-hydroxymyristoyl] N-acetylglucosamine deacetylase [Micavibrio sp.]|tara:strand:+ start:226 stop:1152 length:927 start_codon:yes stop_codon:yes gene_type:complete
MQLTLKKEIEFKGIGLHSGKAVTMRVAPAPAGSGMKITRTDIDSADNTIQALWSYVVPSELCTLLSWTTSEGDVVTVSTVEHILSALRGANIDNAHIYVDAEEIPIMDGSAREFLQEIEKVGVVTQHAPSTYIRILKEVRFEVDDKYAVYTPSNVPSFTYEIDFPQKAIGYQRFDVSLLNGNYAHEVANARTFCPLEMVEFLKTKGLIQGGSLDNAIVVDQDKILNPEGLRFETEFARHKTLDAIGDVYLAGAPILGAFHGYKAGHAMHTALIKEVMSDPNNYEIVNGDLATMLDKQQADKKQQAAHA